MEIFRPSEIPFVPAYGILCGALPQSGSRDGLYPTFCRIPRDAKTQIHAHAELEIFYIVAGRGIMQIGQETAEVHAGDVIRIPAYARHELRNCAAAELEFLSVYTEDGGVPALPQSVVATAAPPTPNGSLHLGHTDLERFFAE